MGLFELILLSFGLAMDAFAVSICKGLASLKVTKKEYLLCGIWFGAFQGLMPLAGYLIGSGLENLISRIAPWVTFALLSLIGGNMIREAFGDDEEVSPGFDIKTMLVMAIATSIDALAVGVAFVASPVAVLDLGRIANVVFAVIVIAAITFVTSMIGVRIGSHFGSRYRSGSEIMGGTILLFIGFRSLITYLDSSNTLSDTQTIFGMLIPLAGTVLGSAIVYAKKNRLSDRLRVILAGCSSGIMLSIAVWGMIEPSIRKLNQDSRYGIIVVTACFCMGVVIQIILDKAVPHTHEYAQITEGPESRLRPEIKVMLCEVIHHIPEGITIGAIYAAHFMRTDWISSSVALVLAIALSLQNIPEALCVSLPIRENGAKTGKAFLMGVVSGIPIPLMGIITVVMTVLFPGMLPYCMAVAGGSLLYMTIEEMPQLSLGKDNDTGALFFAAGFAVVMMMIFLSGSHTFFQFIS